MKPTALGMYIFAGGFTLGVKRSFDVVAHLEEGPYGVSSMRANQPEIPVFVGPDRWPTTLIRDEVQRQTGRELDFIFGNPPCAAWSPIGRVIQAGNNEEQWDRDSRVTCTRVYFNALEFFRPKVWAWESVPQAFTRGRPLVDELTRRAHELGYDVTYVLHNAMYLGTMQHRKRFFMVAHRVRFEPRCDFPTPITVREALARYKAPKTVAQPRVNLPAKFLRAARPGDLREARVEYLAKTGQADDSMARVAFSFKKLALDRVAGAMIGPKLVHPTEPRLLSIEEMKHFSGFPLGYELHGSPMAQASLIGRGVMPPVGAWLAREVARAVKEDHPTTGGSTYLADLFAPPGHVRRLHPQEEMA